MIPNNQDCGLSSVNVHTLKERLTTYDGEICPLPSVSVRVSQQAVRHRHRLPLLFMKLKLLKEEAEVFDNSDLAMHTKQESSDYCWYITLDMLLFPCSFDGR